MKKVFTIGLLALAISASAEAKNVGKVKKKSFKSDCTAGMTSCGRTYQYCDDGNFSDENKLAIMTLWITSCVHNTH